MAKAQSAQTACKHGHPFDASNTRTAPDGSRVCIACRSASNRRHRELIGPKRHTDVWRKWNLKAKYGMSLADYENMLARQGHCCAICKSPTSRSRIPRFHLDHDHATNKVRGLLCGPCNVALGMASDSPELLRKMATYLEQQQGV
jgi:hypothetical protein